MRSIADILKSRLPLIQAPMAGAQDSTLAVAVSASGALGSIPAAMLTPAALRSEISTVRQATTAAFNVNFFCHEECTADEVADRRWRAMLLRYYEELDVDPLAIATTPARRPFSDEMADVVEELRPPVVSFHFGLPSEHLLDRVRRSGASILSTATTVAEARWLEARGVDAVIAQGSEAGGHRGMFLTEDVTTQLTTFVLVPQIVDAVRIAVIATGGIADARTVAAALRLGAAAVQVGTAFLLCAEATTSPLHRAALQSDAARHTAITNVLTGRPARGIVNRMMDELGALRTDVPSFPHAAAAIAPLRAAGEKARRGDFSTLWAGENAPLCRSISASAVVRELMEGMSTPPSRL